MEIVVFNGSPRADGNTAGLLQAALAGMPADAQVQVIDLYSLLPMPCTACGCCKTQDTCMFSDLSETDVLLRRADAFIWALPVYNYSVPAPVKALLDRFQRYYELKERGEEVFADCKRPALLLLTAGRTGLYAVDIIKKQLDNAGRYVGFVLSDTVFAAETDKTAPQDAVLKAAAEAGMRLCQNTQVGYEK